MHIHVSVLHLEFQRVYRNTKCKSWC